MENNTKNKDTKEIKETKTLKKDELISVDELLNEVKGKLKPDWISTAFKQYSGWVSGKSVTRKEFDDKFMGFIDKYMGGRK